jgi:hypothetical protein
VDEPLKKAAVREDHQAGDQLDRQYRQLGHASSIKFGRGRFARERPDTVHCTKLTTACQRI